MQHGISVVICCYNSTERLPATLQHLAEQETNNTLKWEIIVVDNASKDNTTEAAKAIWNKFQIIDAGFSVITELQPGLSFARHTGIVAAKYEYIIFCDDDNWLDAHYIQRAADILDSNEQIGALGGRCEAVSDVSIPFWFNSFQQYYAVGCQALNSGDVQKRNYVYGAGMVIRKSVYSRLQQAGFPSLLTDRTGDSLVSGGDVEICYAHRLAGYIVWYDESLFFKHYMPAKRLDKKYLEKLIAGAEDGIKHLQPYLSLLQMKNTHVLKRAFLFIFYALKSVPAFFQKGKDPLFHLSYAEANNIFPVTFHKTVKQIKRAITAAALPGDSRP